MKNVFKGIGIGIASLVVIFILMMAFGGMDLFYNATIERESINIERENFEQSKSYIQGMAEDLAKYKYELATEENEIARKAIVEMIIDRCSSLDANDLNDPSLRQFLRDVRNGDYN